MKVPVEGVVYVRDPVLPSIYIFSGCCRSIHIRLDNGVGFLMDALAVTMRIFGRVMPCQSSFLSPFKDHRPAGGGGG
jgi:hypothetical protein